MSNSRMDILAAIKSSQPQYHELPAYSSFPQIGDGLSKFIEVLHAIGASVHIVRGIDEIVGIIKGAFDKNARIIATDAMLSDIAEVGVNYTFAHSLANVDLAIIRSDLGVAENGAVWLTQNELPDRVLPFITQHLAIIIRKQDIVPTMQEAYDVIGSSSYSYGTFIAGPSKTADIEQSLVLGAHGPKSMTIFIL